MAAPEPVAPSAPGLTPHLPDGEVVVVLDEPLAPGDVAVLLERIRAAPGAVPGSVVMCDVEHVATPDIGTVDALAQLALAIRRGGCRMRLVHASPDLRELLGLAGLTRVLPCGELPVEVVGEPEQREEPLRVEEERHAGDAAV